MPKHDIHDMPFCDYSDLDVYGIPLCHICNYNHGYNNYLWLHITNNHIKKHI